MSAIMNTYGRLPVTFTSGQGCWITDTEGRRYLDALSGIAVCGLGHANPAVTAAITEQAANLIHASNMYGIARQQELAEALTRVSGMENVFFSNSGAEANEAAIKLARKYGHQKGVSEPAIIVMTKAFHGRTLATLTATGNPKVQEGFGPLVPGFIRAPFMDLAAASAIAKANSNVVAIMLEPVQGEGGLATASPEYIAGIRALCDELGLLMILDEIQTGNGRTGTYFCYQQLGVMPDVVTTAKGLGNGVPIGACLARGKASGILQPGNHGSTYGGNPLACAAGVAVVNTIVSENLSARAAQMGDYLRNALNEALQNEPQFDCLRGRGLMIGVVLKKECPGIMAAALEQGLLLNVTAGNVIRLLPPLTITESEADQVVSTLATLIAALNE